MIEDVLTSIAVSSPVFEHDELIPAKYTCDGADVSPPLNISGYPAETVSLALIVDDPDAPGHCWEHWTVWNISPATEIQENTIPGVEGMNDFKQHGYGGPCPPSGTHQYYFKVYALDTEIDLNRNKGKMDLLKAIEGHVIGYGELIGLYQLI